MYYQLLYYILLNNVKVWAKLLTDWKKENCKEGCDNVGPRVETFV